MEACRKSGQKVSEWCSEQGIPVSTYYSWQRKVYQTVTAEPEVCFTEISAILAVKGNGFILLYKRLENGSFQWPRNGAEALELSAQQYRWLMEGLSVEQPRAHRPLNGLSMKQMRADRRNICTF